MFRNLSTPPRRLCSFVLVSKTKGEQLPLTGPLLHTPPKSGLCTIWSDLAALKWSSGSVRLKHSFSRPCWIRISACFHSRLVNTDSWARCVSPAVVSSLQLLIHTRPAAFCTRLEEPCGKDLSSCETSSTLWTFKLSQMVFLIKDQFCTCVKGR